MTKLLYISNARLPTQMAHGLQIVQNCEAFAQTGATVRLWHARRHVPPAERPAAAQDLWTHYGVARNFSYEALPTLDWVRFAGERDSIFKRILFYVQLATFALIVLIRAWFDASDLYYSRDPLVLWVLGLVKPRHQLVYEAHRLNNAGMGAWLQKQVLRRCALTVAITPPLRDGLAALQADLGAQQSRLIVAHDGIQQQRFAQSMTQAEARRQLGWDESLFIVGYMGRLQTLGMSKGLDTIIHAVAQLATTQSDVARPLAVGIVGGPESQIGEYRAFWQSYGLPETQFLYAGQLPPDAVADAMSAFDLCLMLLPNQTHFRYYTSPMKLFEYMATRRAIIASDLPSYHDVVEDGETALLVPPEDVPALMVAIQRLYDDPALRERLAEQAYRRVMTTYTWEIRAQNILAAWCGAV